MTWLTNIQIVLPDAVLPRGAIEIDGELIGRVVEGAPPAGAQIVNCDGLLALPGIIDMHGDMIEHEMEPRPGADFPLDMAIFELDKRLASCGVTTAYAAISFWETVRRERQRSGERSGRIARGIAALRPQLLLDHRVHARYEVTTPAVAPELRALLADRQIDMLSLMDHTPGQGQYRDFEQYVATISSWRKLDPELVASETRERMRAAADLPSVWASALDVVELARAQRLPIASHDDDTEAKVALMTEMGVSISEFPVTLVAARAARARGMAVAMGAPNVLRGRSHTGNLGAGEAIAAGLVDLLAADYAPAALLQGALSLVRDGTIDLVAAARLLSQGPAAAVGLADRGRIASGLLADLAIVEPGERPRLRATIRRGRPIYWDGAMGNRM